MSKRSARTETYIHRFSNGVTAKATLTYQPPSFCVEWSGKLSRQILDEYLKWRNSILKDFAAKTGERVLVVNL